MPSRKEAPKGAPRPRRPRFGFALPRPSVALLGVIAAFLAGVLYLPALRHGWVWDDALLVASKGAGGAAAEGFRPLLGWLQRGEWLLGAGHPALFHFTNLALHAVGTWLVFYLAIHLGVPSGAAFLTALLFGAHPIHVESVAYVTGRPAMMAAVLSLAALLAARTDRLLHPDGARSPAIVAAYALYLLAALTDAVALVFPFVLLAADRWGPERVPFRARRASYAVFFAIWLASLALRLATPAAPVATLAERGIPEGGQAPALLLAAGTYLRLLVWPHPLNAMRSLGAAEASDAGAWAAAAALLLAFGALVWWRRRDPAARVGAAILGLGLLAALPFPGAGTAYAAERAIYLASAGFCLLAASLLAAAGARGSAGRSLASFALLLAVAGAAYATIRREPVWRGNISLLQAAAAADPADPQPYVRLAEQYAAGGDAASTLAALDLALERDSTLAGVQSRRAIALGSLGRWPEAEAAARAATAHDPDNAEAWANLGDALAQQGKSAEAVEASRHAVGLDSTLASVWYNYGVSLAATGDGDAAAAAYRRALGIDSTLVEAWNNLGALYGGRGALEEARDAYAKAVDLAPASLQARMNLALAYLRLGDRERAAEERRVIQRLDPAAANRLAEFFKELDADASKGGSTGASATRGGAKR